MNIIEEYKKGRRYFTGIDLSGSDLRGSNLIGSNLSDSNLSDCDLSGADICWSIGNGRQIKTIIALKYHINYTVEDMSIGCELYSIEEWFNFDDQTIESMDVGALEFWKENRDWIKETIERFPAEN